MIVDLQDVRDYIGKPDGETAHDELLVSLILRAGEAINRYTDRRFDLQTAPASARQFDIRWAEESTREVPIDDLSTTPTAAALLDGNGSTVTTLTVATDLQLLPLNREAWQPIAGIRFRPQAPGFPIAGQLLSVTGVWGFPSVPEDVKQAALMQIRTWWRRDIANTATGSIYGPEAQDLERPFGLGNEVKVMLQPYQRPSAA